MSSPHTLETLPVGSCRPLSLEDRSRVTAALSHPRRGRLSFLSPWTTIHKDMAVNDGSRVEGGPSLVYLPSILQQTRLEEHWISRVSEATVP